MDFCRGELDADGTVEELGDVFSDDEAGELVRDCGTGPEFEELTVDAS